MSEPERPPTDVGEGYPEDGQPGTGIDPKDHAENTIAGTGGRADGDGDPGKATGNPKAAGAESSDDAG